MEKKFIYKIYDRDDLTATGFVDFIDPAKITSQPVFSFEIDGGQGEVRINYSCDFDDYPSSFELAKLIKIYEISDYAPTGQLLFCGQISKIRPYKSGNTEGVELFVLGLPSMLSHAIFQDAGNYSPAFAAKDVEFIFKDIIADFNATHGTLLDASAISATGVTIDYTFTRMTHFAALVKAFEFAPDDYFWRIDPDGVVKLQEKAATADHRFLIDREIIDAEAVDSVENLKNGYILVAGGAVGEQFYNDATSETAHGKRQTTESDTSITDSTSADAKGDTFIANNKDSKLGPRIVISGNDFDIGGLRPGDTCKILNFKKDSGIFGDNMRIERIDYSRDKARLYLNEQTGIFSRALKNAIEN